MNNSKKSNTSGIYTITHIASGRVYVGQSCNLEKRWQSHRSYLMRDAHDNQKLQRAWTKYGHKAFAYAVVELVAHAHALTEREQHWIDALGAATNKGFNLCPAAGSCAGLKHSAEANAKKYGRTPWNKGLAGQYKTQPASPERKQKIGDAQRGEKNHMFSKKNTLVAIEKMRLANGGSKCYLAKLNEEQVLQIRIALKSGAVGAVLARQYGVANSQISAIRCGKTWRHVSLPPDDSQIYEREFAGTSVAVTMLKATRISV